tara:strand:- start:1220 stop:1855 length:636 start_codon:yes stop_codon:yes gene_type:complete
MSYGYLGDTSTKIKQVRKNDGVISVTNALDLKSQGHLGGSLELIEEQTISTDTSQVDFTSIKQSIYDVHLLYIINAKSDTDNKDFALRVSTSGTFQTGTDYHRALFELNSANSSTESIATTAGQMDITQHTGNATNEVANAYVYIYGAGNSSSMTYCTSHSTTRDNGGNFKLIFGGGAYDQAGEVDGFRIFMDGSGDIASGVFRLYGVKQL